MAKANKATDLVKVYNYLGNISGELWLKSYDQAFVAPGLGEFISVPKYHADNLIARNPGLLTDDAGQAKRALVASRGGTIEPGAVNDSLLDQFDVEQLEAALKRARDAVEKKSVQPGRRNKNKVDTVDTPAKIMGEEPINSDDALHDGVDDDLEDDGDVTDGN